MMSYPITHSFPISFTLLALLITTSEASTSFALSPPNSCSIEGNGDAYGLGIRLNYYLQYISLLLLPYLSTSPESHIFQVTLQTTNILTISIYTCALLTLSPSTLVALEWWILYFLTFMPFIGFVSNRTIMMKRQVVGPGFTSHLWSILMKYQIVELGFTGFLWSILSFAGCWVWFVGVNYGQRPDCEVKLFLFFGAINISNDFWRIIFKIGSVVACTLGVFFFGSYVIHFWNEVATRKYDIERRGIDSERRGIDSERRGIDSEIAEGQIDTGVLRVGMTIFQVVFGIFAIVQVEMTLKTNHVDMAGSPIRAMGQLIPLVAGIYTFTVVVFSGLKTWWKERRKIVEKTKNVVPYQQPTLTPLIVDNQVA